MDDLKTVETQKVDPLYAKQREDVANMRASLLACTGDYESTKQAINNITVLRVLHQVSRIIRYTEMCDKIEEKIYESIDATLESANIHSTSTWMLLLNAQEKLQNIILNSHKLLQPYLEIESKNIAELTAQMDKVVTQPVETGLDANSRDKLRTSARAVIQELSGGNDAN